jgi:parallel beta-helix repeat protein
MATTLPRRKKSSKRVNNKTRKLKVNVSRDSSQQQERQSQQQLKKRSSSKHESLTPDFHEQFKHLRIKMKSIEDTLQIAETNWRYSLQQHTPIIKIQSPNAPPYNPDYRSQSPTIIVTEPTNESDCIDIQLHNRIRGMHESMQAKKKQIQTTMQQYVHEIAAAVSEHKQLEVNKILEKMKVQMERMEEWKVQFEQETKELQNELNKLYDNARVNSENSPSDGAFVTDRLSPPSSKTPSLDLYRHYLDDDIVKIMDTPQSPNSAVDQGFVGSPGDKDVYAELPRKTKALKREIILVLDQNSLADGTNVFQNFVELLDFVRDKVPSTSPVKVLIRDGVHVLNYNQFFRAQTTHISFVAETKAAVIQLQSNWKIDSWIQLMFENVQINGSGSYKIFVKRCVPIFKKCTFIDCRLDLNFCKDVVVEECVVNGQETKPGIKLFKCAGANVRNNRVTSCCNGIELNTSIDVNVLNNNVSYCSDSALYLYVSTVTLAQGNLFFKNKKGITISTRSGGNITNNEFEENVLAVKLHEKETHSILEIKNNFLKGNKVQCNRPLSLA